MTRIRSLKPFLLYLKSSAICNSCGINYSAASYKLSHVARKPKGMCAPWWLRSVCATVQAELSLQWQCKRSLEPKPSTENRRLIRLLWWAGESESSLTTEGLRRGFLAMQLNWFLVEETKHQNGGFTTETQDVRVSDVYLFITLANFGPLIPLLYCDLPARESKKI